MVDFKQLIRDVKLPEDGVPICLRGDLVRQFEQLERELEDAQEADTENSLAAGGQARKIAERMEALRAEMREHTHTFGFRALNKRVYRDLLEDHPPRKGNKDDELLGANGHSFPLALIQACCIDPKMTLEEIEELGELLSEGQLLALFGCALMLNRMTIDIPKSAAASEILAKPVPRSRPPGLGVSLARDSSAGSHAEPPRTSMTKKDT